MLHKRIILDRSYALYLLNYMGMMETGLPPHPLTGPPQCDFIRETIQTINLALLLFDKILIEDSYGSSLKHFAGDKEWFWDLFEVYSPEAVQVDDATLPIMIADSVSLDVKDDHIRAIVKQHFDRSYLDRQSFLSLLTNISGTLLMARALNAAILPWPEKVHLYKYKFAHTPIFQSTEKPYSTLRTVLDLHLPYFEVTRWEDLVAIRRDHRIESFRDLVWRLIQDDDNMGREDILRRLEEEKARLIEILAPSLLGSVSTLLSAPTPFPFNVGLAALIDLVQLERIKPYSWYLFLINLRRRPDDRHDTRPL